jgi:septal ring factor EnvC (AmiA/AmiB activator)
LDADSRNQRERILNVRYLIVGGFACLGVWLLHFTADAFAGRDTSINVSVAFTFAVTLTGVSGVLASLHRRRGRQLRESQAREAELQETVVQLLETLDEHRDRIGRLTAEAHAADAEKRSLESEVKRLTQRNAELEGAQSRLTHEKGELQQQVMNLTGQIVDLTQGDKIRLEDESADQGGRRNNRKGGQ